MIVIVHGSQEPTAWADVAYDNAFAEPVSFFLLKDDPTILIIYLYIVIILPFRIARVSACQIRYHGLKLANY